MVVVGGGEPFNPRPFGENGEEPDDVLSDLAGVLPAEIAPEAGSPNSESSIDQVVIGCVRWFHRRPHGRLRAVPYLWPPVLGLPPMTPDLS